MVIRHNNAASNAIGHVKKANTSIIKHSARLSSGLRINSASDDAAGLSISEGMRAQIRGLERAERNVLDGISLIQTADGALSDINSMLHRLRELAVQSSNDTCTSDDRQKMEDELIALRDEINAVSERTNFNTKTLLDGSLESGSSSPFLMNDGSSAFYSVPATQTGGTGISVNWSNIGGQNLNWFKDDLANNLAPLIVESVLDTFSFADFFKGSTITVNLGTTSGGGANATISYNITRSEVTLGINIGTGLLANSVNSSGYVSDADRDKLHSIIAHEMMHLVMITSTYNLMRSNPSWFVEGIAQAVGGHAGWGLSGTETDTQIRNMLGAMNSSPYDGGYYATMYLGYLAAGGGPITSQNIAKGLDTIMGEIALGYSLDSVINKYTKYTSAANYQQQLKNDADVVGFVRDLISITVDGAGSVLAPLNQKNILSDSGNFTYSGNETYLKIDTSTGTVINHYPTDYVIVSGGSTTGSGSPIHPDYDPYGASPNPPVDPNPPGPNPPGPSNPYLVGGLYIQVGANAGQGLYIYIDGANSTTLGIDSSSVLTVDLSQSTIGDVDNALNKVVRNRTTLGTMQNRLEHNVKSLSTSVVNLSNSESKIRDTDMAKEMMQLIKTNISSQAAQMMLAQSIKQPELILMLLK